MELNSLDILENVQIILDSVFGKTSTKSNILKYDNRFSFACPFCGDSEKDSRKKRGNLYFDDGNYSYHCFNCGISRSLFYFFVEFKNKLNIDFGSDFLMNIPQKNNYTSKVSEKKELNCDFLDFSFFYDVSENLKLDNIIKFFSLIPVISHYIPFNYLKQRNIPLNKLVNLYYNEEQNAIYILNIFNDYVISMNRRYLNKLSTEKGYLPKYKQISYKNICKLTGTEHIEMFNNLFSIFNIMNIDFDKPIFCVEGEFDSMFVDNCVALGGISKKIHFLDDIDFIYIFDNDKIGKTTSLNYIKNNKKVFLWSKLFKFLEMNGDFIKDINDVVSYIGFDEFQKLDLTQFISQSKMDIYFI